MIDEMTLDPPGSIAIVGAGPLGIEAALYGRYLGYDVKLIEAVQVANSLRSCSSTQALSISPDRCLSPLAFAALHTQYPDSANNAKPTTLGSLIDHALVPLVKTDLLRGRLTCPGRVVEVQNIEIERDEDEEVSEEIPPDFRLTIVGVDGIETLDVESVILAIGGSHDVAIRFQTPAPYFFRIGQPRLDNAQETPSDNLQEALSGNVEESFWKGLRQIVSIFASLSGREDLDLYRPRRN